MSQRQWYWQLGVLEKLKFSICMRCCFKKYGGKQKYNQFTSAFPGEVIPSPQKNPIVLQKHFHPEEEEEEGGEGGMIWSNYQEEGACPTNCVSREVTKLTRRVQGCFSLRQKIQHPLNQSN